MRSRATAARSSGGTPSSAWRNVKTGRLKIESVAGG